MKLRGVSTRARLTLVAVIVLGLAAAIADVAIFISVSTVATISADSSLTGQASALGSGLEESGHQVTFAGGEVPNETGGGVAVDVAVVTRQGVVYRSPQETLSGSLLRALAAQVRSGRPAFWSVNGPGGVPRRVYAEPLPGDQGSGDVLVVSRSISELTSALHGLVLVLAGFSIVAVGLGSWLVHWVVGRILSPVRVIAKTARELSERDLHRRVEVAAGGDELGELVATFNGMLARLEGGFDSLQRFTADASHELRQPLTLIRNEVEVALRSQRGGTEYRRVLHAVGQEAEHLARITDQLLLLARADAGVLVPAHEAVDVADLLHETWARWSSRAQAAGIEIVLGAPAYGSLGADPGLIRRILDNLLDNALRYTPGGGRVRVSASAEATTWAIEVADSGPGVEPDFTTHLFTRFGRPDRARTAEGGGAGLGLALSRALARAHGGELELLNPGPGAIFRLTLPTAPAALSSAPSPSDAAPPPPSAGARRRRWDRWRPGLRPPRGPRSRARD